MSRTTQYRIHRHGARVDPTDYLTPLAAVLAVNALAGWAPEEAPEPTEDQAALLERDGYWCAARGYRVVQIRPMTTDTKPTPDPIAALHRITAAVQEIRATFDNDHPTADDELAAILDGVAHVRRWLGKGDTRRIDR